jgi:hypothetical protein
MSKFVPSGYLSIQDALNQLGRQHFGTAWTGDEHKARRGLMSLDEWLKIKDLPPARGGDAPGGGRGARFSQAARVLRVRRDDPAAPAYQDEHQASQRHTETCRRLRQMLEAGGLAAAILDPWTGRLHRVPTSLWRRHDAGRMIEKGEARIPHSPNTGKLLIKSFVATAPKSPMPRTAIEKAIQLLKAKLASERLTRRQQAKFLRDSFPNYRITERGLNEIFQAVPTPIGRPQKSGA